GGGNATFSPKTGDLLYTGSSDLILGAIGESVPGSGIVMDGQANLTLPDVNTYTGPTIVNHGTLHVTGSIAGSSGLTVNTSGAFEAGAQQAVKSLTINTGGSAVVSIGTLKVGNNTAAAPLAISSSGA